MHSKANRLRRPAPTKIKKPACRQAGFTLLEVLIVLFILGLLTAMVAPAAGVLDDRRRTEITQQQMQLLRHAIIGPDDRFDAAGRPVVGGYVGDLHAWPALWEARAEIRPDFVGTGWEDPDHLSAGLGQGPAFAMDPACVFFRPAGRFGSHAWNWYRPYRRLFDDPANCDHVGGLETENEGQPRGLWTRFPEDLPFDLPGYPAPGVDLGPLWKGPYIAPPLADNLSDSRHWAENDAEYRQLEPLWQGGHETWEDGDYLPTPNQPGEFFDDKESFRLLQTEGRFVDGWGRALRFFISADPDSVGETILWILSAGADGQAIYPNKGSCSNHSWTVDAGDIMALAYDPDAQVNCDNIILKLYSRDWRALLAEEQRQREEAVRTQLERIRLALVGGAPIGLNSGFCGALGRYPRMFRWEGTGWDDQDAAANDYTVGQPRGLWTAQPGAAAADDLPASSWGLGWRHAYLPAPAGSAAQQQLCDAWGRDLLFFYDAAHAALLVLSRGEDGLFNFGDTDTLPEGAPDGNNDYLQPADPIQVVDVTTYAVTLPQNRDNIHLLISAADWRPGYFRLPRFTVLNAGSGTTKARFFRAAAAAAGDLLSAAALVDADGDTVADDWVEGDGTPVNPAFNYDDMSAAEAFSGARYLVFWQDADADDHIDAGELYLPLIYNLQAVAGSGQYESITIDTTDFTPAP